MSDLNLQLYFSITGGVPGDEKPKKKKSTRDDLQALKKQKNDPNAPGPTRMPFPDLKDIDKAERAKALKEMTRRQTLSAGEETFLGREHSP